MQQENVTCIRACRHFKGLALMQVTFAVCTCGCVCMCTANVWWRQLICIIYPELPSYSNEDAGSRTQ